MKTVLSALLAFVGSLAMATETFVYTAETLSLLHRDVNILRADDAVSSYASTSTTGFYETNAKDANCLTDGAIYFVSGYNERSDDRYLVRSDDVYICRFSFPKRLDDVRFWTYWPDGYRNDITVAAIEVTYDGSAWEVLPNSAFNACKKQADNTVEPYLGEDRSYVKGRCVRFANDSGEPLANGILGLRVVFGTQELGYTAHWELEAKGLDGYEGDAPVVRIGAVSSQLAEGGSSAHVTVEGSLPYAGQGADEAVVAVRWGTAADQLDQVKTLDGTFPAGSAFSVVIEALEPNSMYYVQLDATVGAYASSSDIIRVSTRKETVTLITMGPFKDRWENIEGTQFGLETNLPGGTWICGGGWEWSQPKADKDNIKTDEEKACFALPLLSTETYEKPTTFTLTAEMAHSQGAGALGFWHEVPLRSKYYPLEDGQTEKRIYDATVGFTGIAFNPAKKTLRVYEAGKAVGEAVSVMTTGDTDYHTLVYTVDTTKGTIEWVTLNGHPVHGLTSTAFTDANTDYVGLLSLSGGRTGCKYFEVSEGREAPAEPVLSVPIHKVVCCTGEQVAIPVSAINSATELPIQVRWTAPDCAGATFSDDVFAWTAGEPGVYTLKVSASVGTKSVSDTVEIRVYPVPPAEPTGMKPVFAASVDLTGQHQDIKFAGTTQVEATDRTDLGLSVNKPGATWIWNSGWDNVIPIVYAGSKEYNLRDELSSVLLSLQDNGSYVKPAQIFVSMEFTFSGRGVLGFWSGLHDEAGKDVTGGFTGLCFEKPNSVIRLYVNGAVVGGDRRIEFLEGQTRNTLRFVLDRKAKVLKDVVFNGVPVGDFEIPTLTDAMTSYVGVGALANFNGNSRLQFQSFRVDGQPKGGLVIVIQ